MCHILNMSEFWIFVNFCQYDRFLNMHWDALRVLNIQGFRVCQGSAYMQVLNKVLNMPEYG